MALTRDGRVRYELKTPCKDGTTHVIFAPLDFMAKLAALVPMPRVKLTRFHGVFAPNSNYRVMINPAKRGEGDVPPHWRRCESGSQARSARPPRRGSLRWANLLPVRDGHSKVGSGIARGAGIPGSKAAYRLDAGAARAILPNIINPGRELQLLGLGSVLFTILGAPCAIAATLGPLSVALGLVEATGAASSFIHVLDAAPIRIPLQVLGAGAR